MRGLTVSYFSSNFSTFSLQVLTTMVALPEISKEVCMSIFSRRFSKWTLLATATAFAAVIAQSGETPTFAQGPFPGRPSINVQSFNACTTTNYGDIAAKAMNTTSVDIRKALVNGQNLQDILTAQNVQIQTVVDAVQTARKADIDQAAKDGVITQDEANALENPPAPGTQPAPVGTRPAGGGGGGGRGQGGPQAALFPDISTFRILLAQASGTQPAPGGNGGGPRGGGFAGFGGGIGGGIGPNTFNLVKQYVVAAQALNMKCPDLVKTLITPPGKSIVAVAADQKVDPQTVSDALTKAYKDALAQDVTDGVITQ